MVIPKLKIKKMGERRREITVVQALDHAAHSSALVTSDFSLSLHLKIRLSGQKFHEDEEVKKNEATTRLRAQAAELHDIGIQKLVPR
jgi:hypothetical protein